jgi:hypothetical protein
VDASQPKNKNRAARGQNLATALFVNMATQHLTKTLKGAIKLDCTPLVRGVVTNDPEMPVGLKMSASLARYLIVLLEESKGKYPIGLLYASCLEKTLDSVGAKTKREEAGV